MSGIIINIDPVLLRLWHLELRWYSLAVALAIVSGVFITAHRAKKKGIASEHVHSLSLWVVLGGIVGARLFHVIDHWEHYIQNPLQIFGFQGLAIWGALAGGGLALILYARSRHLPFGRLVDALAPGLLVAQIIGRFGCIVNGDAYGGITSVPWAFIYINPGSMIPANLFGVPTHPYPVYEMIWNAIALLVLLRLDHYFKRDGMVFLSYLFLYGLGRFVLTFVRQETITLWGLQQAQVIAVMIVAASVAATAYLMAKQQNPVKLY
ncbi:MAG: prolipoprotein diacylglyceryl transferase [Dehalococcoidales bacterium]|nr:prolipoprotein diacylglyceryl transferase [Dehalococcoidales bacterium]MDZ4246127.1 prolipoprotein diacylglyceryl transferase [Dehalococcoidia bacterium]